MNERIRQLDKAAQEYAGRICGNDEDSNWNEWLNVYKETFAELIVRECLNVINQPNGVGDDDVIRISDDVKRHFGVE